MPQPLIPAPASGPILWATRHRALTFAFALVLAVLIALLDYATGYAWRFAILYLIPVALVTWTGGARAGLTIAAISSIFSYFLGTSYTSRRKDDTISQLSANK